MLCERTAQGERQVLLQYLQPAIDFDRFPLGHRTVGAIQLHAPVDDVADGNSLSVLRPPAPQRLQGHAFAHGQGHDFGIEHVGHDLPRLHAQILSGILSKVWAYLSFFRA